MWSYRRFFMLEADTVSLHIYLDNDYFTSNVHYIDIVGEELIFK